MADRDPLLLRVLARLGEVSITEAYLPRESGADIYGQWTPDGEIVINPIPQTVDTVIHELLHDLKPQWSEHAIRSVTGRLLRSLSDKEIEAIYCEYRKRVRRSASIRAADNDRDDL